MVIYACLTRFSLHDVDRVTQHSRNDSIGTAVGRGAARGVTGMFAGLYHCYGGGGGGRGAARGVTGMFAGLYHCYGGVEEVQPVALLVCSLGYTIAVGGWKDGLVVETGYMHKVYASCTSNIP